MSENDHKLMTLLLENKEKFNVVIDNDDVSAYNEEWTLIGRFNASGSNLLEGIFNYLGINAEPA